MEACFGDDVKHPWQVRRHGGRANLVNDQSIGGISCMRLLEKDVHVQ